MDEDLKPRVPLWRRFCPELAVYLPKYVTVQNPKLGIVHIFLMLICISLTLYYFISNDKYMVIKSPITSISICKPNTPSCLKHMENHKSLDDCKANTTFVRRNVTYQNISCATSCGIGQSGFGDQPCLIDSELLRVDGETVFIPTFFRDEIYVPKTSSSNNCSTAFQKVPGKPHMCTRVGNYFVAGAEQLRLIFDYAFHLRSHENMLDPRLLFIEAPQMMAHTSSFNPDGWDLSLYSVFFDARGKEVARFEQGKPINVTVQELLDNAFLDGTQSAHASSHHVLDTRYSQPDLGMTELMPLWLTGASLTIDLYITDLGECPVLDTLRQEVRKIRVDSGRPVACMHVHVFPNWEVVEEATPLGSDGSLRLRQTHGIHIRFRKLGKFTFVDERQLMESLTVFLVWIQIPVVMTYWFCIYALGMLSKIYRRVIHQELNLREACTGLVARLMCHSAAFMDLRDHERGISKARILQRLGDILECHESIDDDEHWRFAEFVFEGLKMYRDNDDDDNGNDRNYVDLQEFCEVCSSCEPLTFQNFVRLFDNDRRVRPCERTLLDKPLREMLNEILGREPSTVDEEASLKNAGSKTENAHSRVNLAVRDVQELMDHLGSLERKTFQAAAALEVGDEVLALVAPPEAPDDSDMQETIPMSPQMPTLIAPITPTSPQMQQLESQLDPRIADEAEAQVLLSPRRFPASDFQRGSMQRMSHFRTDDSTS
mmetsp:Transcript_27832/g.54737  ORF Transcript_27832/g.54737 Transcript_27832/m.54737 type:complete len:715 (+) Transcript_27832:41-2185(+)